MVAIEVEFRRSRRQPMRESYLGRTASSLSQRYYQWAKKKIARRPLKLTQVRVTNYLTPQEARERKIAWWGHYLELEVGPYDWLGTDEDEANAEVEIRLTPQDESREGTVDTYKTRIRSPQLDPLFNRHRYLLYLQVSPDLFRSEVNHERHFIDVLIKRNRRDEPVRAYSYCHRSWWQKLFGL